MSKKDISFVEWLGFRSNFDFSSARPLGALLGFCILIITIILICISFVGIVLLFAALLGHGPFSGDPTGAAIRNISLVIAAIIGLPFVVWRSIVAHKNAITAEQSQITDRINKAVQGLGTEKIVKLVYEKNKYKTDDKGNWLRDKKDQLIPAQRPDGEPLVEREQYEETQPNIEVRVGAVLSLERILRDSNRDFKHIMGILATYVRENAKRVKGDSQLQLPSTPREDIIAAVKVIGETNGRRDLTTKSQYAESDFNPDFSNTVLDGLTAPNSNFSGAILSGSSWVAADIAYSNFQHAHSVKECDFSKADLEGCDFAFSWLDDIKFSNETTLMDNSFKSAWLTKIKFGYGSQITTIDFSNAIFSSSSFLNCFLYKCSFKGATLGDVSFYSASMYDLDFTGATSWEQSDFDGAFGIKAGEGVTLLPSGATYPEHWIDLSELDDEYDPLATFEYAYEQWKLELYKTN